MTTPRPSLKDVAAHAGVSVGTVSHVLNHPARVTEKTRAKVLASIQELGFIRSNVARQLRQGSSNAVGVLGLDLADPEFAAAVREIESVLSAAGLALLLASTGGSSERESRAITTMLEHQVMGIVWMATPVAPSNLDRLVDRKVRTVLAGAHAFGHGVPSAEIDHVAGGRVAVAHLIASGHTRVAVICIPNMAGRSASLWAGACEAAAAAGLDPSAALLRLDVDAATVFEGTRAVETALETDPPPTGVFACHDHVAVGARRGLEAHGRTVPGDAAVVGYGDTAGADPGALLTTIRLPNAELGRRAAQLLLDKTADPTPVWLAPQLVVRQTA